MPAKFITFALVVTFLTGPVAAQPDPKKDDKKLVTRVYNIKPLIGERGKASGLADADAVIKFIIETIPELRELKPGTDGPQIVEREGGKLAVRATAAVQDELKDLLEALERLQDLAVDLTVEVLEFDTATYEKWVKALPKSVRGKPASPVFFATGEEPEEKEPDAAESKALEEAYKIFKSGRLVQTSSGRFVNGVEAIVSARRTVATFTNLTDGVRVGGKFENPQLVKEGFSLVALPVVSADRRFVRFKLTEHSTVITGVKKRELAVVEGKPIVMQSVETEDLGATGSAVIPDGGRAIFRLAYAPKDKVWLVVLNPRIYIRAEEEEIDRQRLRKWFDLFFGT
jgi:hypothetical protein